MCVYIHVYIYIYIYKYEREGDDVGTAPTLLLEIVEAV